ncbi:MAG: nucleotidyltransferase domain-containing protein [Anaerolineae bacterium]|nr:nucleotidyltransferase domain-containing protein [Anaerolineae bacterium]
MGVMRIGVFGSVVRGETDPASDIDVLATLKKPSFRAFMQVKFALEDMLERPVDLVLEDTLREELRPTVLHEVAYAEEVYKTLSKR